MKILTPGHKYELSHFEFPEATGQTIQFIEKVLAKHKPDCNAVKDAHSECDCGLKAGQLDTVNDGTTNEEVLAVLIDRLNFLNAKFPCRENSIAITKCDEALLWLNKRTAGRIARGVEGQHKA